MSETDLEEYLILRNFDEPISEETFDATAGRAGAVLQDLTDEGVGIRWVESRVRTRADGTVTGTFCHYRAEDEEALREHGARSGLPVTRIDLLGKRLASE